jgi:hypothetical protein
MLMSMNAPISRSSAVLLAAGAVGILLLGAFFHLDPAAAPPALPAGSPADSAIESAGEPKLPADLSPGLADIIRLAQAHVDENVILAFILNSGQTYSPTADDILYLSDLGLSQTVIGALFKQKPPAQPEMAATAGPTPVDSAKLLSPDAPFAAQQGANAGLFYNALAPYGAWTQVPDYGLCWQPTAETLNPDWRPYVDQGQWLYTDNGWYWRSDYSWGWAVFHYGRWSKNGRFSWVWVPDNVWGPAWVSWRIAWSYSGWAPLPPGVGLAAAGLTFNHHRVAPDSDVGLPGGWFTFVSEGNFLSRNLPGYAIPASQAKVIYSRSVAVNNYSIANQKVLNLGPGRAGIAAAAEVEPAPVLINQAPARKSEPAAEPQIAPENDPQPPLAPVTREEGVSPLPRQSLALPVQPPPQPPRVRHRHWAENYPAYWSLAGAPRWGPFINHEFFRRDQNVGPFAQAPQPDPARLMAASVPAGSKSGK